MDDERLEGFAELRRASDEHRPDGARMWRRVERGIGVASVTRLDHRRRTVPLAIAAGITMVILATTQLLVHRASSEPVARGGLAGATSTTTTDVEIGIVGGTTVHTGTSSPPASHRAPSRPPTGSTGPTGPTGSVGPTATAGPTGSFGSTATTGQTATVGSAGSAGSTRYLWSALPPGPSRTVTLSTAGSLDWVLPGVRTDLVVERAKRPSGPALSVGIPVNSTSRSGPLRVSWTGGYPEQKRKDADAWLVTPAGGSVTVGVPAAPSARRLLVYLGGPVTLAMGGVWVTAPATGEDPRVLTVDVPAGGDLQLSLTGGSAGLALGPVVLVSA